MLKQEIVYRKIPKDNSNGYDIKDNSALLVKELFEFDKNWIDLVKPKEGYFFTQEKLKKLLEDTFDAGKQSNISNGCSANLTDKLCYCRKDSDCCYQTYPTKQEYINKLLNQ